MPNFNVCEQAYPDVDEFICELARASAVEDLSRKPSQAEGQAAKYREGQPRVNEVVPGLAALALHHGAESGV